MRAPCARHRYLGADSPAPLLVKSATLLYNAIVIVSSRHREKYVAVEQSDYQSFTRYRVASIDDARILLLLLLVASRTRY